MVVRGFRTAAFIASAIAIAAGLHLVAPRLIQEWLNRISARRYHYYIVMGYPVTGSTGDGVAGAALIALGVGGLIVILKTTKRGPDA